MESAAAGNSETGQIQMHRAGLSQDGSVHHIVELTEENVNDQKIALDQNNLRSLCGSCHKRITRAMKQKAAGILEDIVFDENGYPVSAAGYPPPGGVAENFAEKRPTASHLCY